MNAEERATWHMLLNAAQSVDRQHTRKRLREAAIAYANAVKSRQQYDTERNRQEYAIKSARSGYYQQMTGIGPMFGGTVKTAWRAPTKEAALAEKMRFPTVASVGCRVVALTPIRKL